MSIEIVVGDVFIYDAKWVGESTDERSHFESVGRLVCGGFIIEPPFTFSIPNQERLVIPNPLILTEPSATNLQPTKENEDSVK